MASYMSPGPLCDCCKYCTIQQRPDYHSRQFKAVSISPVTGIVFKAYEYSAIQLADAFEKIVPGYMDLEIKILALERWNALRSELLEGPLWRDTEFDLRDFFSVFDDLLFLRALGGRCRVEWVDRYRTGLKQSDEGWCEPGEETNQGPIQWIRIVRPTAEQPKHVHDILGTLLHEMCHALFAFTCNCYSCRCPLNKMNGEGLGGHGPSWEKLRGSVEESAETHSYSIFEPITLCHPSEPDIQNEKQKVGRMLDGLYKKITYQGSESAEIKRLERARKRSELDEILASIRNEQTDERIIENIAFAGHMFRQSERERIFGPLDNHVACASAIVQHREIGLQS